MMRILVTGAEGFVGKNLLVRLGGEGIEIIPFTRSCTSQSLAKAVARADFIFHLAGVNRPKDVAEFVSGNVGLTEQLCEAVRSSGNRIPVAYTSSIQADNGSHYGQSKLRAEQALLELKTTAGVPVFLFRLPNI